MSPTTVLYLVSIIMLIGFIVLGRCALNWHGIACMLRGQILRDKILIDSQDEFYSEYKRELTEHGCTCSGCYVKLGFIRSRYTRHFENIKNGLTKRVDAP